MEAKHTPGPWRVSAPNQNFGPKVWGSDDHLVADCGNIRKRGEDEEAANATLIAAAPELLTQLQSARTVIGRMKRSMLVHPDCETGSEFDDITTEAQILEDDICAVIERATTRRHS